MANLADLAIRKRSVIIALALLIAVGGVLAARNLRTELLPSIQVPIATVLVVYPGADPQSVLDQVTVPVETSVSGIAGLRSVRSIAESGLSLTIAEFEYGTNMKDVLTTINQNVATLQLPSGALQPRVGDFDLNALPFLRLSLTGEAELRDLGEIAEGVIKPRLESIDGVRAVELVGKTAQQVVVSLDSEKMAQAGMDVSQVSTFLQASNILLPSGDILEENRDVPIRAGHRITSTQQIEELVVRPSGLPQAAASPGIGVPGADSTTGASGSVPPSIPGSSQTRLPDAADSAGPETASYRVQPGDTLWDIALRHYGDGSAVQMIAEANRDRLLSPDLLQPGTELRLPQVGQQNTEPPASIIAPPTLPAASGPQEPLRIRDFATVKIADSENSALSRTNGHPSIGVLVYRTPTANTVKVAAAVKKALDEILPTLGNVEIIVIEDQSLQIQESIDDLAREAILGALFAVFVIYLFLLSVRTTLVAAVSIPLSMLITLIILFATDMSLNMMTLGGMTVAVGRVVDDTVVVLENIYRHIRRNEGLLDSIRAGLGEVGSAIISSTLTTVGVFLPLAFVGGIVGEVFRPFAVSATYALLASLLVACTVIPAVATFLSSSTSRAKESSPEEKDTWLQKLYTPTIRWSLQRRRSTITLAIVALIASLAALPFIGTTFLPEANEKLMHVQLELPPGTDKDITTTLASEVEDVIGQFEDVEVQQTTIGNTGSLVSLTGFGAGSASTADVFVRLRESANVQSTVAQVREALSYLSSSATVTVASLDASGTGSNDVEIVLSGNSYADLQHAVDIAMKSLGNIDGLANLESDISSAKPEVSVVVDPEKAIQHGTTAAQVAMKVREIIIGKTATTISIDGVPIDVLVRVQTEDANSVEKLKKLPVGTLDAVQLSDIADVRLSEGPVRLTRRDQRAAVTISGSINKASTGAVNGAVRDAISAINLPAGVSAEFGGVIEQQTESFANLSLALVAAVALVYLIMMATMGSLLDPLIILVTLPLASLGALLSLLVTGRSLGIAAMIGMLMLIGIVVTNAIVLLDLVRRLRAQGFGVDDALVQAGRMRIRPILMTAATTVLALVPSALGLNEGSRIATEMATVVIGGLSTSTLLTLIVVPVVYRIAHTERQTAD